MSRKENKANEWSGMASRGFSFFSLLIIDWFGLLFFFCGGLWAAEQPYAPRKERQAKTTQQLTYLFFQSMKWNGID